MNTMTQITQMPVIKGPEKSYKPSGQTEDSFAFSNFLKDATKLKQDLNEKEKNPSLKGNATEAKENEKLLRKDEQANSTKEKTKDEDQSNISDTAKGLTTLNENNAKIETLDSQIIPVLSRKTYEELNFDMKMFFEEPVIQEMKRETLNPVDYLINLSNEILEGTNEKNINLSHESLGRNISEEIDVLGLKESFVGDLKSDMTTKEPMIADTKINHIVQEKVVSQIIPGLAKENGEDSIAKDLKIKEFNETEIKTDIESKGEITGKTKIESGSLKMSTLSDGKNVPKEENVEIGKNILDGLQPKGLILDKSEVDNLKTDTGAKDLLAPAVSVERSAMDFRIQPKATPINENFQKNLEMATNEIMNRVTTLKEGANTTMTLKLFPEDLGELEISLLLNDGKLTGKILTDHKDVRELFLKNIEELTNTLKDNKVNVTKFEVGEFTQNSFGEGKQDENRRLLQTRGLRQYGQKDQTLPQEVAYTKNSAQKGLNILA